LSQKFDFLEEKRMFKRMKNGDWKATLYFLSHQNKREMRESEIDRERRERKRREEREREEKRDREKEKRVIERKIRERGREDR
jgi:hypothetical protein